MVKKKITVPKIETKINETTDSTNPELTVKLVTDSLEIQPLELNLGREDLNKVVEKLNEVIKKVNK